VWKVLHMSSYIAYILATAHGLLAGTDAEQLGFRLVMLVGVVLSLILVGYRLGRQQRVNPQSTPKTRPRRAAAHNAVIPFSKEKEA
jgi:DMSO/TMAO reductase YedYZ heme-binding membrane subunit